jgi:hypothetical protein
MIRINCAEGIVKEKIAGKKRNVPKHADYSSVSLSFNAEMFSDKRFVQEYLAQASEYFNIIQGYYGCTSHIASPKASNYDRIHSDLFDPSHFSWANWLGPELVDQIGRNKFRTAPFHSVTELKGGGIIFTICENPLQQDEPEVIEKAEKIRKNLGILTPSERDGPEKVNEFNRKLKAHEEEMKRRIETAFRTAKEETAKEMSRQAEGCREGGKKFWNVSLDYSEKSIRTVDQILEKSFDKNDEEAVETAIQAFGAYLGETIRKMDGGAWRDEEMNNQPVLMDVGKRKDRINPFDLVRKKLEKGDAFSIAEWYQKTLLK